MNNNIGTLTIEMAANIARLQKDMENVRRTVEMNTRAMQISADLARGAINALGVSLSVASFAQFVRGSINAADRLNDLRQQLSMGIKELATWQLVANQSGTSLESLGRGVKNVGQYYKEHGDRLRAAGITAKDANGILIQLADVFSAMPEGIDKTNLAIAILGKKVGPELIPALNMGSKGLQQATEQAAAYAAKMEELAPKADHFNDQLAMLKLNAEGLALVMGNDVMSVLGPVVEEMAALDQQAGDGAESFHVLGESLKAIVVFGGNVSYVLKSVGIEIGGIAAQIAQLSHGNFAGAGAIRDAMVADAAARRRDIDAWSEKILGLGYGSKTAQAANGSTLSEAEARRRAALLDADEKAAKAAEKARMDLLGRINETHAALLKETDALTVQVEKQREHIAALGLTNDQTLELEASRLALESATKRQQLADNEALGLYGDTNDQLRIQIGLLDELYDLKLQDAASQMADRYNSDNIERTGKLLEDGVREWEKWEQERQRAAEDLGRSLADNIMRGGKSAGEYLQDYFRTLVLRPVIEGMMAPVANAVTGALYGGGGSAGGGGSLLNAASGANSIYNAASGGGMYGSLATSAFGQWAGLSSMVTSAPVYEAGGALVSAGSSGLGLTSLGAALPWIGGGLAIASMLGLFGGGGDDPHNNPDARYLVGRLGKGGLTAAGGNLAHITMGQTSGQGRWADYSALSAEEIAAIEKGGAAVFVAGRKLADILGVDAEVLNDVSVEGERFKDAADMVGQLSDAVGLKLIPNLADFRQGTESLSDAAQRVVGDIQTFDMLAKHLGLTMQITGNASQRASAIEGIVGAAGGSSAFASSLTSFYGSYYSDAERQANAAADLREQFQALGYELPATKDEFRRLVTGLDITTEAGRATFATLIGLSGAFASVADAATAATNAALGNAQFVRAGLTVGFTTLGEGALGLPSLTANSAVLGSYASGTSYVPQTGLYQLHEGEGVLTRAENLGGGISAAEARSLRAEMAAVRKAAEDTAYILRRVTRDGNSLLTETA